MKRRKKRTMALNFVLFLGPTLLLYLVIEVIPLIMGVVYSFTDWDGIATEIGFVGFKNYIDLFTDDPRFWKSMLFTFENTAVVVIVSNLIGFVLAYNLSKKIPFRNFMRAAFYLPRLIGGVILGFVWQFIFLNIFPFLGEKFGIGVFQLSWLGTPATSFWALAIVQAWGFAGYMMIIYVAGLTAISSDYIEAAVIDGATAGQQLRHVILPLMMPAITECLFLSLLNSFKVYDVNLSLTGGGPYRSSEAITMNVYTTAFAESQLGYGSAKAIIMALVIIAVTLLQVKLTSKKEVQM
ncbi:MAG TPA: sugar ABC transporter permease [Candidatus Ruthenibacterium merdigallinarum]|nr:sugar ABC transporter permease [Candidatus Ruthenibacterium merdigallinarum]